jgi:hypothetical protein
LRLDIILMKTLVRMVNYRAIRTRDPEPVIDHPHFVEQEPYRILVWRTIKGFGFIQQQGYSLLLKTKL